MTTVKNVLFLALPDFDRSYKYHRQMRGGVGYRALRSVGARKTPRTIHPILDLLYGASVAREAGHQVRVDDDQFRDSVSYDDYLISLKERITFVPDVVFVRISLPSVVTDLEVAAKLRSEWPEARFVGYGPLFSGKMSLDYVLGEKVFSTVVTSELESVVLDIIADEDQVVVPGAYGLVDGSYACANPNPTFTDMQSLPYAAYDLVDYAKLDRFIVQTQRGCPLACGYCPYYTAQGKKFRAKTPERVVDELAHYYERYGVTDILIHDPIFSLDKKRVEAICDGLIARKLPITWQCETHFNHVDEELLVKMKSAGMKAVAFGVESANPEVLKRANRRYANWDKAKAIVDTCKRLGIVTHGYFIMGLAGDNPRGILATFKLARYIGFDRPRFNVPQSYPGTEAFNQELASGFLRPAEHPGGIGEFLVGAVTVGNWRELGTRISRGEDLSDRQTEWLWYASNNLNNSGPGLHGLLGWAKAWVWIAASFGIGLLPWRAPLNPGQTSVSN